MLINCEHPRFIRNPRLKYHPDEIVQVVLNDEPVEIRGHYKYGLKWLRSPSLRVRNMVNEGKLTPDTIDKYYVVLDSGVIEPIYMMVPCGHCTVCREIKKNEWVLRSVCETAMSINNPYFITLTYSDENYPVEGVLLTDIQKFLKRLRVNMSRTLGLDYSEVHLRYMYCAEYGKNTHRGHYHLLLWNVPKELSASALHALCKLSWSKMNGHKARKEWKKNFKWYFDIVQEQYVAPSGRICTRNKLDENGDPVRVKRGRLEFLHCTDDVPDQIGFVYTRKADSGCCGYICKYMRKDCFIPYQQKFIGKGKKRRGEYILDENGEKIKCNDTFFHASRRGGGIGAPYLPLIEAEYLRNPDYNTLEVNDPFSGITSKGAIPHYFKNKLTPSLQLGIKYDMYHKFERLNVLAYGLAHDGTPDDMRFLAMFNQFVDMHPVFKDYVKVYRGAPDEYFDLTGRIEPRSYEIGDGIFYNNRIKEFVDLWTELDGFQHDYTKLALQMKMRIAHALSCREYAELHQLTFDDISNKAYKYRQRAILAKNKEIL